MEIRGMKRKELQALCKKHGVPANLTNREMADRLSSLFEETEKSVAQGKSNSDGSVELTRETDGKAARRNVKKVRFSPVDETFVFVSSNVKITSRKMRALERSNKKQSLAAEKSRRRVVSVRTLQSPVRATRSKVQKVVDEDVPQVFSPGIRKKSRRGNVKVDINGVRSVDVGDTRPELSDGANSHNPPVEVAAPLRWNLRSRGVGVEKDGKVEHTITENTRKNEGPKDFKKRKRNGTEGHSHLDDKPEGVSLAPVRPQQRKTTRHSKRIERRETDSELSVEESEAVKSVGRTTRSRAPRVERASTVKAINEIVEVQLDIDKVVQLGQSTKIMGRKTQKSFTQEKNPTRENDGVWRGKHSPVRNGKERNGPIPENNTRKRTTVMCLKAGASELGVAVDTVNGLLLRRSRRKAIPSAVLTDKEFIAHPNDRKNVRSSPYNRESEVVTHAKEQSLKTLMTKTPVLNKSRVSSDAPVEQKGGKAPNGKMEYFEPSTEEPRTSRQSKRGTCKSDHGASMNSIGKVDAKRLKGSATITEDLGARAMSAEVIDEPLNIYVYLDVPAVLEHEDVLEKNGKTDKPECFKNKGSEGKRGDITGVNSFDCCGVNIYKKDDLAAQSGDSLVSAAEKPQEVDVKCGLEELSSDSVVITEKTTVLIEDDRGKVQDSVNMSCQASGRAKDSIPEEVPSGAKFEVKNAVSHQDASLTLNLDSVDEPSNAPLCSENKLENEHVYIGEDTYSRSVEELVLEDHMDESGQRGISERVPLDADEHAYQIALLDSSSNEEHNQAYEAGEAINLGLQVGNFKTASENAVSIQLNDGCCSARAGTPELLALRSGEANKIKTRSSVVSSLQRNGHFGGDRYQSRETEFSSERAQPEQTVIDANDGLCTPKIITEEPGRKQGESPEPLEIVEAAVVACEVTIEKVAEENQSADGSFSLSNPPDAKITGEKVCEVEEGSSDIASEKLLGSFIGETSGKDLSIIPRDGCNTPVAKECFLSYEPPLQKDSEKQGQDVKGQCPLLEERFCSLWEEISQKPVFKSESDLSSMEVGMDNQEKIEEDSTTDEDNVVHFGTALVNACDDDLKDKLQVDCTDTCCPDELGSDTDDHKEKCLVMRSFESVFIETVKSHTETINAQAVGLVTSPEGIVTDDRGICSQMVALHSPRTSANETSSCMNDVSKDNDGYEAGGSLEDEILSPVIDGNSLGQENGFVVPDHSSHGLLDANSEESRFEVEENSFFNSSDVNNMTRRTVKTEVLVESALEVISSRKDQVLDMKEVMNHNFNHQVCGILSAEIAEIDTVTSRVASESVTLDESNALRSCQIKVHSEIKDVFNIACNTEAITVHECLKEQNLEQCNRIVEEGDSHFSPDQLADKDDFGKVAAQLSRGPEEMVALGRRSVDITQSCDSEFPQFQSPEIKGAVSSPCLRSYCHKQEEMVTGGRQEEMGNKMDEMELIASSNSKFSENQSANHSEILEMTKTLGEEILNVIEVGNCHLPRAGGEHLNVQKEAVNFHQHNKGSMSKIYEVGGEASSANLTIKVVDMINKEEDGNATSVFLQDRAQFYGDKSTKIDLDTPIIPGVAADNPKCNFNEVLGAMLHSDEQEIDLFDDQRGTSLRPDQKVPAILEYSNLSETLSADVGIYVKTTESTLILKDIKTDAAQLDANKLLMETHLDEVSSRTIEAAPNTDTHVELVNTSHEDIIRTEDEPSALTTQENQETFYLDDGSTPAGETTMSLHGMSIGYELDKKNSVGEEYPSKANNVDIGTNAEEKSNGYREEVTVQEAHEPQEDHVVLGNASSSNHSSKVCREIAKQYARDDEVASVQTDLVLCESSHTKYESIVKDNEESHGSGRVDEPATESKQLSANADFSSDFSLLSSIGDPAILENKFLKSQVESQTFTNSEISFVFRDNSLDSVRELDADAEEERLRNVNGKYANSVEVRISRLEQNAPVAAVEDLKDDVDHSNAQITILNETSLKNKENREDIRVTDDKHSKDGATSEYSHDMDHELKDVTEDHCSNCLATDELTIKNDKESPEQEVSAMIQEYIDREKMEDGSIEVRVSCVDSGEEELAHVNASDRALLDAFPILHDLSDIRKGHSSSSSFANENVELDVAENVRMRQLNLISPLTKSLDVKVEEPGKLINSSILVSTKARSNFTEKTPKKLLVTSDMKENMPSTKWEQVSSVTASTTMKTRRVLEDLQRKRI